MSPEVPWAIALTETWVETRTSHRNLAACSETARFPDTTTGLAVSLKRASTLMTCTMWEERTDMVTMTGDVAQTMRYEAVARFNAARRLVLIRSRAASVSTRAGE